jgi:hypothetical protein
VALDCEASGHQQLDDSERLIVQVFSVEEACALLDEGLLEDAFTALPLFYYLRWQAAGRL